MRLRPRLSVSLYFAILFLVPFTLFLKTFCSSVYADDSGETITIAKLLGSGHPPGYPLHTLLGNLVLRLPLGDPAPLYNLWAGFLAALAAPLAALLIIRLSAKALPAKLGSVHIAAAAASLAMVLGPVSWQNALVAKGSVYGLNNTLSLVLLLLAWESRTTVKAQALFWLTLGLSLAHHYMSQVVLLPAYWLFLTRGQPLAGRPDASFWKWSWLVLPGLSLYLYFPLRSANTPAIDWGKASSFRDLLFYISRAQYAAGEFTRSLTGSLRQLLQALLFLLREAHFGLMTFLALFGAYRLGKSKSPSAAGLGLAIAAPLAAVTLYLNLKPERLGIMAPYLFPAYIAQALLAAEAIRVFAETAWDSRLKLALAAAMLAVLVLSASFTFKRTDKSDWFYAIDNARNTLLCLPPRALLLTEGDSLVFPLWYLQHLKGERKDVVMAGLPLIPMDWVRDKLQRDYPDLRLPSVRAGAKLGRESIPALTQGLLHLNSDRPRFSNANQADENTRGWLPRSHGLTYELIPAADPRPVDTARAENHLRAARQRGLWTGSPDEKTRRVLITDMAVHHNTLGTYYEDNREYIKAMERYQDAFALAPWDEQFAYNSGNAAYRLGRKEEALYWYEVSLGINPAYANAWFNTGVVLASMERHQDARAAFQKVEKLDPGRPAVRAYLGR